ncbi:MAG: acylphosphatase [Bacteroidetes bacterium]|nr:acylphosphatase [Bacteroidota bacterium]
MIQYEIKITGRVQGVGFRYFARLKASEIGINGWVKNSRDGGVLIVAQGNETDINTFIDYLQIGPTRARVNKISKYKIELLNDFDNFSVKY